MDKNQHVSWVKYVKVRSYIVKIPHMGNPWGKLSIPHFPHSLGKKICHGDVEALHSAVN